MWQRPGPSRRGAVHVRRAPCPRDDYVYAGGGDSRWRGQTGPSWVEEGRSATAMAACDPAAGRPTPALGGSSCGLAASSAAPRGSG